MQGKESFDMTNILDKALAAFPRFALMGAGGGHEAAGHTATPIQELKRLTSHIGGHRMAGRRTDLPRIFVKRDDACLVGGGGNKLRKLEYLIGAAQAQGADTLIALGALQSNHARLTAAAAIEAQMHCEILLARKVPRADEDYEKSGNVLLDQLFGAEVSFHASDANLMELAHARANVLRGQGRKPFIIPFGGSDVTGAMGYARAAGEIATQARQMGVRMDVVVVANGSAGTHAGLVAGMELLDDAPVVLGYSVLARADEQLAPTRKLAQDTLTALGGGELSRDIQLSDRSLGAGYGIPTDAMKAALRLVASTEGLVLDPVYTGKAFAGLLADIEEGKYGAGQNVLFVMTGGLPGLFAYRREFLA
jgi:D-cysteine desulfhydrase